MLILYFLSSEAPPLVLYLSLTSCVQVLSVLSYKSEQNEISACWSFISLLLTCRHGKTEWHLRWPLNIMGLDPLVICLVYSTLNFYFWFTQLRISVSSRLVLHHRNVSLIENLPFWLFAQYSSKKQRANWRTDNAKKKKKSRCDPTTEIKLKLSCDV